MRKIYEYFSDGMGSVLVRMYGFGFLVFARLGFSFLVSLSNNVYFSLSKWQEEKLMFHDYCIFYS